MRFFYVSFTKEVVLTRCIFKVLNFLATMENGRLGGNEERRDRLTNLMNDAFQILPGYIYLILF